MVFTIEIYSRQSKDITYNVKVNSPMVTF